MRISVCIPTHKPDFLQESLESVYKQTFTDWEIVLCPNGSEAIESVSKMSFDPRVVVIPCQGENGIVGEIKNFTFSQAKGEILVELDHDDILTPNALEEINKAFRC